MEFLIFLLERFLPKKWRDYSIAFDKFMLFLMGLCAFFSRVPGVPWAQAPGQVGCQASEWGDCKLPDKKGSHAELPSTH